MKERMEVFWLWFSCLYLRHSWAETPLIKKTLVVGGNYDFGTDVWEKMYETVSLIYCERCGAVKAIRKWGK